MKTNQHDYTGNAQVVFCDLTPHSPSGEFYCHGELIKCNIWNNIYITRNAVINKADMLRERAERESEEAARGETRREGVEVVIVHCSVRPWWFGVRQCGFPPSSPH